MGKIPFVSATTLMIGWALAAPGATPSIENEWVTVRLDADGQGFEIRQKQGAAAAVIRGRLPDGAAPVKVVEAEHRGLGRGQALRYSGGTISVYPGVPFAFIRGELHNDGPEETVLNRVPLMPLVLESGRPADALVVYGTGTPPVAMAPLDDRQASADSEIGSYTWIAVAEPESRHGVVAGWVSHDRSSGVIFPGVADGQVQLTPRADYGRLRMRPGARVQMESFAIGGFDDARLGLEAYADAMAAVYAIELPPQPSGHCTWYHGRALNEGALTALADFAHRELLPFGYEFIQIDDGWQAGLASGGPAKDFSDYRRPGPYGEMGMKGAADMLRQKGFTAGLWLIPFAGTHNAPEFADRQHWFVRRDDGAPFVERWGGTSLDMTHPEAQAYVRDVIRRMVDEWGYTYLKLDGLWTGMATGMVYVNDKYREDKLGNAVFHNPDITNVEAYRNGLKIVREAAGPGVYILGCNVAQNMRTFGASVGLVDGMRTGADNAPEWLLRGEYRLLAGVRTGTRNYFMHRRVWHNDPDPVYVRPSLPLEEARVLCSWVALSGQLTVASDNLQRLPPERLDMLRRIMPAHEAVARPADYFEEPIARIWLVTDTNGQPRRNVVGLFNWDDDDYRFDYSLVRTGLDDDVYVGFDFWGDRLVESIRDRFTFTLPARSCMVLAVRPEASHPQVLSTSRHVTQGMIDLVEERWDEGASVLRGVSRVVGGDRYELRVVLPRGDARPVSAVGVSAADRDAGVTIDQVSSAGRLIRVEIASPTSREVAWTVTF